MNPSVEFVVPEMIMWERPVKHHLHVVPHIRVPVLIDGKAEGDNDDGDVDDSDDDSDTHGIDDC